jgi:hypothetical protein
LIISIILILLISGYVWLRFSLLKTKNIKPDYSKEKSVIDLRPLVIAKMQQLVKDGSGGLYNLSIAEINPAVMASEFDIINATLTPDSAALAALNVAKKAPDDVFKLSFDTLHITGISLLDFLHKKNISLDTIYIRHPVVQKYHDPKPYNIQQRKQDSSTTIYQKLEKQFNSIAINAIEISNGSLVTTNIGKKNTTKKLNDISITIRKFLFDSSTQFDSSRFFFARDMQLSSRNYLSETPNGLYTFNLDKILIDAAEHSVVLNGVAFLPRGNRAEFEKKQKTIGDMFTARFPKIVFNEVNWQQLMDSNAFIAGSAVIDDGSVNDYLDRTLPHSGSFTANDFPQQLLMKVPIKLHIHRVNIHNLSVEYEEFSPESMQSGKVSFSRITGSITNVTNMPAFIQKNHACIAAASGLFMQTVAMKASMVFNLSRHANGGFSVDVQVDSIHKELVNPVANTLGLFDIKSGTVYKGNAHVQGNNFSAKASGTVWYDDLKVAVLKKNKANGRLKNKTITSFIANTFIIKKSNPEKGEAVRSAAVVLQRGHKYGSFFNFVWGAIRYGLLKIIGVPVKG